jgi:3-hydroxyisobutyrate dehydrogenase
MGPKITHFGESGQGQNAKAANQILTGVNLLGVCEALTFGKVEGYISVSVLIVIHLFIFIFVLFS